MIKFEGYLSENCKDYMLTNTRKIFITIFTILCIPIIVCSFVFSILNDWIFLLMLVPVGLIIFLISLNPKSKLYKKIYDKHYESNMLWVITIDEDIISVEGDKRTEDKYTDKIKKVVDMGEWYKIYFNFPHKSDLFVCQKSLIVEGTIEEFEKLFEDKLVRK